MSERRVLSLLGGVVLVAVGAGIAFGFIVGYLSNWNDNAATHAYLPAGVYITILGVVGWFANRKRGSPPFWYIFVGGLFAGWIMGYGWYLVHRGLNPEQK